MREMAVATREVKLHHCARTLLYQCVWCMRRHTNDKTAETAVLNFAARVISGRRKFDHINISDMLKDLEWLTTANLHLYHSLTLLKQMLTAAPANLSRCTVAWPLEASFTNIWPDRLTGWTVDRPAIRTDLACRRFLFSAVTGTHVAKSLRQTVIQTEAERRRRSQTIDGNLSWVMYVCMGGWVCEYVWYLELSREPRHVAQQTRYQNVGLRNGYCLGTISSGCDF